MKKRPITEKRKWTNKERLDAITSLVNVPRTEELLAARAAVIGVSSRTLHRWIAAHDGMPPGSTKLRFDFPAAALFVAAEHYSGVSTLALHRLLQSEWASLYPGKPCPCYTTLLSFVKSLRPVSQRVKP
jgi:hypothetical protein